jgi:hypothetical protein
LPAIDLHVEYFRRLGIEKWPYKEIKSKNKSAGGGTNHVTVGGSRGLHTVKDIHHQTSQDTTTTTGSCAERLTHPGEAHDRIRVRSEDTRTRKACPAFDFGANTSPQSETHPSPGIHSSAPPHSAKPRRGAPAVTARRPARASRRPPQAPTPHAIAAHSELAEAGWPFSANRPGPSSGPKDDTALGASPSHHLPLPQHRPPIVLLFLLPIPRDPSPPRACGRRRRGARRIGRGLRGG